MTYTYFERDAYSFSEVTFEETSARSSQSEPADDRKRSSAEWRHAGLELPSPDRALHSTRSLLVMAGVINLLFVLRLLLQRSSARSLATYIPVLGGVLELGMLYLFWMVVLDALRTHRPLRREPWLWLGVALSLLPPVVSALRSLAGEVP